MKRFIFFVGWLTGLAGLGSTSAGGALVLEIDSPYHHIKVLDEQGMRTLSFDGSMETRMSLANPREGHFQYIEYFHMPWLWNASISNVLVLGLGGGSVQRSFQYYCPHVAIDTVEIDPVVVNVAKQYFGVEWTPTNKIMVEDGRVFLRRTRKEYDLIVMDAYVKSRYGSFIPYHLVTKEFFQLTSAHLSTNGVLAYNVIGSLRGFREDLLGAVYKTLKEVFPQVYLFPADDSQNVVLIATKSAREVDRTALHQRASQFKREGRRMIPTFATRVYAFRRVPPFTTYRVPVLTDDFAPVDGLFRSVEPLR